MQPFCNQGLWSNHFLFLFGTKFLPVIFQDLYDPEAKFAPTLTTLSLCTRRPQRSWQYKLRFSQRSLGDYEFQPFSLEQPINVHVLNRNTANIERIMPFDWVLQLMQDSTFASHLKSQNYSWNISSKFGCHQENDLDTQCLNFSVKFLQVSVAEFDQHSWQLFQNLWNCFGIRMHMQT